MDNERKHPEAAAFDSYCYATYVVGEVKQLEAKLHFVMEKAKAAVQVAETTRDRVDELCKDIRSLAANAKHLTGDVGEQVEHALLELLDEKPKEKAPE